MSDTDTGDAAQRVRDAYARALALNENNAFVHASHGMSQMVRGGRSMSRACQRAT